MNKIILVGRLTREVELRYIAGSGTPVAQFTLAVDREFTGKDGKRETDFIDVQVWGKQAETSAQYLGKGSMVSVSGSLRIDNYKANDGSNRRSARVNADRVEFLITTNRPATQTKKEEEFVPTFEPTGLDADEWTAIDGDDLPF